MPGPVLYYIRHGETDWNALGKLQGTQDVPINERGRAQAAQAGHILSDLRLPTGATSFRCPLSRARLGAHAPPWSWCAIR